MSPLDINTLERKLAIIVREIDFLTGFIDTGINVDSDLRDHYAILHSLQNALSATIDIAQHIVCEVAEVVPDTYADAILKLAASGYLEDSFARKFSEAARFRNKLVHSYEEIDMAKVLADLPEMIADLKLFSKYIADRI